MAINSRGGADGGQTCQCLPISLLYIRISSLREQKRKEEGVGVMKDKELKFEEIEVSHTLGGTGEDHVPGRGNWTGCRYSGCGFGVGQVVFKLSDLF